MVKDNSRGEDL